MLVKAPRQRLSEGTRDVLDVELTSPPLRVRYFVGQFVVRVLNSAVAAHECQTV